MRATLPLPAIGLPAARATLAAGGVLAFATESSYGLGVDPRSAAGVEALYRLKGRERGKALPVIAADLAQIEALGVAAEAPALLWAKARWPAALTVVLPIVRPLPASAGGATIAVRVPARETLRGLLLALGTALTATSANPSGGEPISDPTALADWLSRSGERFHLIDEGVAPGGDPSTLVELAGGAPKVLRQGSYRVEG